jgi:hypothetical protein
MQNLFSDTTPHICHILGAADKNVSGVDLKYKDADLDISVTRNFF